MNPHMKRARTRKVRRICRAARMLGQRMADTNDVVVNGNSLARWLEHATLDQWTSLAVVAGTHTPSRFTRARVVSALRRYDQERRAR
jgi:hypothetical protein